MIVRTIMSVLEQDWPADRLTVVVSDGDDPHPEAAVAILPVLYRSPADRFAPGRDGAANAGNLNSALGLLDAEHPHIRGRLRPCSSLPCSCRDPVVCSSLRGASGVCSGEGPPALPMLEAVGREPPGADLRGVFGGAGVCVVGGVSAALDGA
jgi:hypothetical protein